MANIAAPTKVSPGGYMGEQIRNALAYETIVPGAAIKLRSDGKLALADRDADSGPVFVALNGGAAGEAINYMVFGAVAGFTSLTVGAVYYLSDTAGRICPVDDVSGTYVPVGYAKSAAELVVISGIAPAGMISVGERSAQNVGPLANQADGATVTVRFGAPLTGRQWIPRALQVYNGTATLATAQLKFAAGTATAAVSLTTDTLTTCTTFTDSSAAAGQAVTVDLVTGATTGALNAAVVVLQYSDVPA